MSLADAPVTQKQVHPGDQLDNDPSKPTLVVLGSGWGATSFLKNFDSDEYNVVVISPRNYFLFTPLLPSVTVGTLEPRSIIQPTRYITRHKKRKVAVYEAEAQEVDPVKKSVTFKGQEILDPRAMTIACSLYRPYRHPRRRWIGDYSLRLPRVRRWLRKPDVWNRGCSKVWLLPQGAR